MQIFKESSFGGIFEKKPDFIMVKPSINVTPDKVEIKGFNKVLVEPQKNGDVKISAAIYEPVDKEQRDQFETYGQVHLGGFYDPEKVITTNAISKTITPKPGQVLVIQGGKKQIDDIVLRNPKHHPVGFSSIEIDGQGGLLRSGFLLPKEDNAGDNIFLDLTDKTPITVHGHDGGARLSTIIYRPTIFRTGTDVISIQSSQAGSKLNIISDDKVEVHDGLFGTKTLPSEPVLTNNPKGLKTLKEIQAEKTKPSVVNFTKTENEDGSHTLIFK